MFHIFVNILEAFSPEEKNSKANIFFYQYCGSICVAFGVTGINVPFRTNILDKHLLIKQPRNLSIEFHHEKIITADTILSRLHSCRDKFFSGFLVDKCFFVSLLFQNTSCSVTQHVQLYAVFNLRRRIGNLEFVFKLVNLPMYVYKAGWLDFFRIMVN